jgi:hypothetical protein
VVAAVVDGCASFGFASAADAVELKQKNAANNASWVRTAKCFTFIDDLLFG